MNTQNPKKPPDLTPTQLADKLKSVIKQVQELAKSDAPDNEWARDAVKEYKKHFPSQYFPDDDISTAILLPVSYVEKLCPELMQQIIKPALEIADNENKLFKKPAPLKYIAFDSRLDNCNYHPWHHAICIGTPYLAALTNKDEVIATISHEWGHAYQNLRWGYKGMDNSNCPTDNKHKPFAPSTYFTDPRLEFHADNSGKAIDVISSLLFSMLKYSSTYYDDGLKHPNSRTRIKSLLKKELGYKIFGMNGGFSKDGFIPIKLEESHPNVQTYAHRELARNGVSRIFSRHRPVTEDGKMVANHMVFSSAIERKSEELMLILDDLVKPNLTTEKKEQWLELVKTEIEKFTAENKPKFVDKNDIFSRANLSRIKPLNLQRGGSF